MPGFTRRWRSLSGYGRKISEVDPRPSTRVRSPLDLEALEIEVGNLRRELGEAQERIDFTERVMAQAQEQRRVGPEK